MTISVNPAILENLAERLQRRAARELETSESVGPQTYSRRLNYLSDKYHRAAEVQEIVGMYKEFTSVRSDRPEGL